MILGEGLFILRRGNSLRGWDGTIRNKQTENGTIITDLKLKPFTEMRLKFLVHLYLSTNL